jgi:hypothetical protein
VIGALAPGLLLIAVATAAQPDTAIDPSQVLPVPPVTAKGEVPLSRPVAPVPLGLSPWSVSVSALAGVADPFYGKVATWVSVRRGFGVLGLELFGGKAFSWAGAALDICSNPSTCSTPAGSRLGATPGNLGFMGGVAGVWRAAEGKASLAGLGNRRFGLDVSFGAAALQYTVTENTVRTTTTAAGRLGLALEGDLTPAFGLRLELQDLLYPAVIRGEHSVQNEMLAGVSVAWRLGGQ